MRKVGAPWAFQSTTYIRTSFPVNPMTRDDEYQTPILPAMLLSVAECQEDKPLQIPGRQRVLFFCLKD
jgi:hypothetical protein